MHVANICIMAEGKKVRLEWLDALRGFTMILVVANHVSQMGFGQEWKQSSALSFLILFRMPLFFFVSGFLAYKASQVWNRVELGKLMLKKVRLQIIPTVVFFLLSCFIIHPDFCEYVVRNFHSPMKGGYWFTIALLWMFIIYYLFSYFESKLRVRSWVPIALFFLASLVLYETCYLPKYFAWAQGYRGERIQWLCDTSLNQVFMYLPFFVFGIIVRRYWEQAQKIMDSKWFYPIVIAIVIWATVDYLKLHVLRMAWANVPSTLAKFGLLIIVFMYFRHYKEHFTKFTLAGNCLQYIGRRTLDIYLIHFFFMPNVPAIGSFLNLNRGNFVLDIVLSVAMALLIIGFCVVVSNILRVSPLFRKYLFGK